MPRPRVYEHDRVLDAVEALAAASGPAGVTIRGISAAVGVSNGAVYHSFGSRSGLVAHAWLRAGRRFLSVQSELVDDALAETPVAAVVAAADAPVAFAERYPESSKLLWAVSRDELLESDLPAEIATELSDLNRSLVGLMIRLATNLWDRKDARAVDAITTCIVDLPTAIVLNRGRLGSPTARAQLHAAVRAVLDIGPPPLGKGRKSGN